MCSFGKYSIAAVVLLFSVPVICQNILFLQTTPSKSHHIWNKQIFDRLYENGYNLTILSYEEEHSIPAFNAPSYTAWLADIPTRVTTMPNYASNFGPNMTFLERCWNLFYWTLDYFYRQWIFMSNEDGRVRELFGMNSSSTTQLEKKSEIVLVNMDFSMDYHQSLPPNVIPVGGLHISRQEQLSPDLEEFLDRPSKAVILFSLGTNVKSEGLGLDINRAILDAFVSLPEYNFIWKHGDPVSLGSLPANVFVRSWIPQGKILSSGKVRLLISHGGLLSLQEAVWYGAPVVGIPFFADQYQNVDKLVRAGVALRLPLPHLNRNSLTEVIQAILQNDRYHENMLQRSKWFKNQPEMPLDRAIYSIEKVIQCKGSLHLQSPTNGMTPVQAYGIDLLVGAFITLALVRKLVRHLLSSVNKLS
ncbi:UDP-glucosyltransferase 2-like isoform X2 [Wyeomyia smithii]|uniref:UDP-glucosyltransferase 2-like isoform X2 n=1 Tax=Wyeomyia smithii TaxID=174621 RepID=UPI002467BFC5|nr:UDP-glucosyltransferase 2-like isoform X2 [Wyeomyia smithii]